MRTRGILLVLALSLAAVAQKLPTVVDLTHTLGPKSPDWEGTEKRPFDARDLATFEKNGYFTRYISMQEHFSTHIDAPAHFSKDGWTVDQIPADHLVAPLVVLDISKQSAANADYAVTVADIAAWETKNGPIPVGAVIEAYTGWAAKWDSMKDYRNADAKGTMHFPGYSLAAAQFLVEKRGVYGLGIDTLSVDVGMSSHFPVHAYTSKRGVYHLENSTHLDKVPSEGATVVVGAAKLEGGSGGPVRILALIPATEPDANTGPAAACDKIKVVEDSVHDFASNSPNGTLAVCVKDDLETSSGDYTSLYLARNGKLLRLRRYFDLGPSKYLQWSPDSAYFAYNWTSGGAVGQWHIDVYGVRTNLSYDITKAAGRSYLKRFRCKFIPEDVNMMFLDWSSTDTVLLAAELHPVSSFCEPNRADDAFYEVSVPSGRVLKEYHGAELEAIKKEFSGQY